MLGILGSAASGMVAMTSDLGTISQNISNINTTGYKTVRTGFQTLMSAQLSPGMAGDNPSSSGDGIDKGATSSFGVGTYTQNMITTVGTMQSTGIFSDVGIDGQGLFMMAPAAADGSAPTATSSPSLFTRAGNFITQAGSAGQTYLTNGSGDYVLGWQGTNGAISASGAVSPIYIPAPTTVTRNGVTTQVDMPAQATTSITLGANVTTSNLTKDQQSGSTENLDLSCYDSLSNSHPFTMQFSPIANTTTTTTTVDSSTTPPTVTTTGPTAGTTTLPADTWLMTFGTSETGATITQAAGTTNTSTSTSGTVTTTTSTATQGGVLVTFNPDGTIASPSSITLNATWADGQTSAININTSGLTQYGGTSTSSITSVQQNGYPDGMIENLSFGTDGVLSGTYTNGQSLNIAQLALAEFPSENSLNPVSSTMFTQTPAAGTLQIMTANQAGASIEGGDLETSTVDLSTEFSNMILAQKAYSMNSQTLQTADKMLQTVRDLIT